MESNITETISPCTPEKAEEIRAEGHALRYIPSGIEKSVCEDIARRQALGIAKYGQTVADNPLVLREWLNHAYEETLDKAVYLKRAIAEIDREERGPARYATCEPGALRIFPGEPGYENAHFEEFYLKEISRAAN